MYFLVPLSIGQILGNSNVDGSWVLSIVVAGFGFLFWQYLKSIREEIKEIDVDVKDIKRHMVVQDIDIAKIKVHLKIHE